MTNANCFVSTLMTQPSARGDPRLQHNMALVEYCSRNCTDSVKIMKKLSEISQQGKKRYFDLWRRACNGFTHVLPRICMRGDLVICECISPPRSRRAGEKDKPEALCTTEPGVPLLLYNQSVLLYQAKKYRSAMALLETIFENIEPVPESIAHRVCFLLMELYGLAIRTCSMSALKCQEFKNSAKAVMTYLHKPARKGSSDTKSSGKSGRHSVRAFLMHPPTVHVLSNEYQVVHAANNRHLIKCFLPFSLLFNRMDIASVCILRKPSGVCSRVN